MPILIDTSKILVLRDAGMPLLDARSPVEFERGHIVGAVNFPVLSDEEREIIGTLHARSGAEAAVHRALELLGPQFANKLAQARRLCRGHKEVAIHCWRGGMRSRSLAWLLELGGFTVYLLEGGYKAYRTYIRAAFLQPMHFLVLGGMTGCGKTDILHELHLLGEQVIDLEGLAHHRGSAFGAIGMEQQPNNEHFESVLYEVWRKLDPTRPVWVEDESNRIGTITIADTFYTQMRKGQLITVAMSDELRIKRLVAMYTEVNDVNGLLHGIERIAKRLGGETTRICCEAVQRGDYAIATQRLLQYYDKGYTFQHERAGRKPVKHFVFEEDNPYFAAQLLHKECANLVG